MPPTCFLKLAFSIVILIFVHNIENIVLANELQSRVSNSISISSQISQNCLNLTVIRRSVFESEFVFLGKILNLVEVEAETHAKENVENSTPAKGALFSVSLTNSNTDSQHYAYYHYKYHQEQNPRRRRHLNSVVPKNAIKSYIGTVQVKTIFKRETQSIKFESQSDFLNEGTIILVKITDNLMNSKHVWPCNRRLRMLDSRIFFIFISIPHQNQNKPTQGADNFYYQSPVSLPPTLGILRAIRHAVKSESNERKDATRRLTKNPNTLLEIDEDVDGDGTTATPTMCSTSNCHHSSRCFDHSNGNYSCLCSLGSVYTSNGCSNQEQDPYPFFSGHSTISFARIPGYHKLSFEVEILPFSDNQNGIIIFASQFPNGSGDYMSIALIDGFIEFRYDLGDGLVKLSSTNRLASGLKYVVVAKRYNREGLLLVNDDMEVHGSSMGNRKSLELDHGGYMGFVPLDDPMRIREMVGTSNGFVGCIQNLEIGRRLVNLLGTNDLLINSTHQLYQCPGIIPTTRLLGLDPIAKAASKIKIEAQSIITTESTTNPTSNYTIVTKNQILLQSNSCSKVQCQNQEHGRGWTYKEVPNNGPAPECVCEHMHMYPAILSEPEMMKISNNIHKRVAGLPEFTEKSCHHHRHNTEYNGKNPTPINFDGQSFIEFPNETRKSRSKVRKRSLIEIVFRTRINESGALIWTRSKRQGCSDSKRGGHLGLFLNSGRLELRIDLGSAKGSKAVIIQSKVNVADGRWHQVLISRRDRFIVFQIDDFTPVRSTAPFGANSLHSDGRFWIGGVAKSVLASGIPAPFHQGFVGCVDTIRIDMKTLPLYKIAYSVGLPFCQNDS